MEMDRKDVRMTASRFLAHPITAFEVASARVSLAAGAVFVLLLGGLHLLEPEFDPTWRFISEYALGRFGWLMPLAFLALAVSLAGAGAVALSQLRTVVGYLGLVVLAVGIVGLVIAAIFKTDPISTNPDAMTDSGKMHVLGASLDYSPVAFLLLSFGLARNLAWQSIRILLFVTAGVSLLLTVLFILTIPPDAVFGPGVLTGLVGRLLVLSYLGWVASVAFHALKLGNKTN